MKLTERKKLPKLNLKIFLPMIILSIIGIFTLLSTIIQPSGGFGELDIVWKQVAFVSVGMVIYVILMFVDLSYLKYWQVQTIFYVITLVLLVLTLLIGPTINNVKRWLVVGGIQIQASEIAKVVVILFTASIFALKDRINQWLLLLISFVLTAVYFVLIFMEPSGSMSLLLMSIWFLVAFLGLKNTLRNSVLLVIVISVVLGFLVSSITGNGLWLLLIAVGLIISIFAFYHDEAWQKLVVISFAISILIGIGSRVIWQDVLRDYQKNRVEAFFNPEETQDDIGFNVNQAKIAIGSGQIFGKGFGNGTQSKRNFLPEYQTDFIFASFAEEFGLVGSLLILTLYSILILTCFNLAITMAHKPFYSLIAVGIGLKLLLEVFINIGTNTGVIPATGIPLPLMSSGGSITIMTFVCLGLIQNISTPRGHLK
jgi:rod shape determining protein RodA